MKRSLTKATLVLCLTLAGCSHANIVSTHSPPLASPEPISSSAQVVKISSSPVAIPSNGSAEAVVTLSISPGFHINANPATFPYLIATELQKISDPDDSITAGKPVYPPAVKRKFQFANEPLAVYEGDVSIKLPLRVRGSARSYPISIEVRVQACDNEKCFPPVTIESSIPVKLN
jgi:hypothetical protein